MTTQIVENLELFSEAELEALEFVPEELENIESVLCPNLESISLDEVAKDLEAYFEGDIEEAGLEGKSRRRTALGNTPGKKTTTGQDLLKRWDGKQIPKARLKPGITQKNYKKPNDWEVHVKDKSGNRQWMPLDDKIHMGHKVGAVTFWEKGVSKTHINKKGKYQQRYNPYRDPGHKDQFRSPYARDFMKDSKNYRFELGTVNSSAGAKEKDRYKTLPSNVTSWPT